MFSITVRSEFCAAHALTIAGVREPTHGHNFCVCLSLEGPELDSDGLLCDFHTIEDTLGEVLEPMNNADLNAHPPFDTISPTAERIAEYIAHEMIARLDAALAPHARVAWVSVTEAPGCEATYRPAAVPQAIPAAGSDGGLT
jgi:6-pyruvoyltetrahydropterin/6-carboxytetrahydropterin synthase